MTAMSPEHPEPLDQLGVQAADLLRSLRIPHQPGLSALEIGTLHAELGFQFCSEHGAFLRSIVPVGDGWPDWRGEVRELRELLAAPVDGVLFDVTHNDFWPPAWGPWPTDGAARDEYARQRLALVPKLIPVYRHRYLPAAPAPEPAPVLSLVQTDLVCYGRDLIRYLRHEFGGQPRQTERARPVPFWSELS